MVKSAHGGIAVLLPGEEFRGPVSVCRMDYEELGSSLPGFETEWTVNILYKAVNINATALRFCAVRYFKWLRG